MLIFTKILALSVIDRSGVRLGGEMFRLMLQVRKLLELFSADRTRTLKLHLSAAGFALSNRAFQLERKFIEPFRVFQAIGASDR